MRQPLWAAFVLATTAQARFVGLDGAAALALPGVVRLITCSDVPGANGITAGKGAATDFKLFLQPVFFF